MLIIGAPVHYFFTPLLGDFTQNGAGVATLLKMGGDFTQNGTHGQATLLKMGRSRRASAVSTRRLADTRAIQILNQSRQSSNHDFMVVETDLPLLGTTTVLRSICKQH